MKEKKRTQIVALIALVAVIVVTIGTIIFHKMANDQKSREIAIVKQREEYEAAVKNALLGKWGMAIEASKDLAIASVYTFTEDNCFTFSSGMSYEGIIVPTTQEQGSYNIDTENSIINLKYDNEDVNLVDKIPYSFENGKFVFNSEDYVRVD